jgi:hypothetical protein
VAIADAFFGFAAPSADKLAEADTLLETDAPPAADAFVAAELLALPETE